MSWSDSHSKSERLAGQAEEAALTGDRISAESFYLLASEEEEKALAALPSDKLKTRGITAVSAVALAYKGRNYSTAQQLAYRLLATGDLPTFAQAQLQELLQVLWVAQASEANGKSFLPGDLLVSLRGGLVTYGGAPLDLVLQKLESIQAVLCRTAEMLLNKPLRKRGAPEASLQSMLKPWLLQAPAGSYQFGVRVEEPKQLGLWSASQPLRAANLVNTVLRVLNAAADDPENDLPLVVPNTEYRRAFISLARNLAPRGKTFERLEIRDAGSPSDLTASFVVESRNVLNEVLRKSRTIDSAGENTTTVHGVLRGLHLDKDWLEISAGDSGHSIRIDGAGEVLDDLIGPMVNRKVAVTATRRGRKQYYRDIELED